MLAKASQLFQSDETLNAVCSNGVTLIYYRLRGNYYTSAYSITTARGGHVEVALSL